MYAGAVSMYCFPGRKNHSVYTGALALKDGGKAGIRDKIILYAKIRKDSQNKRVLSGFFNIYRVYYKLFTASAICLEVRPYSSNRAAGVPDCPNRSLIPTFLNLKSPFPIRTSATASPKPPMMECSSTVRTFPQLKALFKTDSQSIGFI